MQPDQTPRAMKQVGELFLRYQQILQPPQRIVEDTAVTVIAEITSYSITRSQVRYVVSTKTLHLHTPSILKSEILFYRERILCALLEQLGEKGAPRSLL